MKTIQINSESILIQSAMLSDDIQSCVEFIIELVRDLPPVKTHPILIKPNLNNDLIALTGNSTDLRLIAAVLSSLKKRGYTNITVGDGSNVGTDRRGINVLSRLSIDKLCERYGVKYVNLNKEPFREIKLYNSESVRVADICFDSYLISMPKIKTHAEAWLSCACKNLMGCIAGGMEKKKMHAGMKGKVFSRWTNYLGENIVSLNEHIKPDLNIVDGIIAMEGNGPGDGSPRKTGIIVSGKNNFVLDLFISRLVGLDYHDIPYLMIAIEKGYVTENDIIKLNELSPIINLETPPKRKNLTKLLGHNMFIEMRDNVRPLFDNKTVMPLLYQRGIIQDVYDADEGEFKILKRKLEKCQFCLTKECEAFCPVSCSVSDSDFDFNSNQCIECLYCFFACPHGAIQLEGNLGYLKRHNDRYKDKIRKTLSINTN